MKGTYHTFLHFNSSILIGCLGEKKKYDEKMHSLRVHAFGTTLKGVAEFRLHCGLKNISSTENFEFSSYFHSHLDAPSPSPFPYVPKIPSVLSSSVVLISCTPWVNYFVSLWIFLTSNKGINQTSTFEVHCIFLLLFFLVIYYLMRLAKWWLVRGSKSSFPCKINIPIVTLEGRVIIL